MTTNAGSILSVVRLALFKPLPTSAWDWVSNGRSSLLAGAVGAGRLST